MSLRILISIGLFLILNGIVEMSPISSPVEGSLKNKNEIENLFFMNEDEEKLLEENAVNNSVIEKVKARILNSLNLTEAPKSRKPAPLLLMFIPQNNSWSGTSSKNLVNPQRDGHSEFFYSEIVPNTCFDQKGVSCIRFQISLKSLETRKSKIPSEIWLYKKEGITQFKIKLLKQKAGKTKLIKQTFEAIDLTSDAGWIRLDATLLLTQVSSDVLDLEVYSESSLSVPIEVGEGKIPFLISFQNSLQHSSRSKRSTVECGASSSPCCVKNLYVSFKELNWDSWIVYPKGYNANICKGSCEQRNTTQHHTTVYKHHTAVDKHHTTVMNLLMSKCKRNISEISQSNHCSPREYKPLSIIYNIDESGVHFITELPNMSVSECSCL